MAAKHDALPSDLPLVVLSAPSWLQVVHITERGAGHRVALVVYPPFVRAILHFQSHATLLSLIILNASNLAFTNALHRNASLLTPRTHVQGSLVLKSKSRFRHSLPHLSSVLTCTQIRRRTVQPRDRQRPAHSTQQGPCCRLRKRHISLPQRYAHICKSTNHVIDVI